NGAVDARLYNAMRDVVEHCTACGRCMANCPVKIPSWEVALTLRALLDHEGEMGHPIKEWALEFLSKDIASRVPKAAKMASLGQKMQNRFLGFVPKAWKNRIQNPIFSGQGPKMGYTNLYESLKLQRGHIFTPGEPKDDMPLVFYFPGCGGALFYDRIGISSLMLLLYAGYAVALPPKHCCCGYPLLAAGMDVLYEDRLHETRQYLSELLRDVHRKKFVPRYLVSACGTCRDSLERMQLAESFPMLEQKDVVQLVLPELSTLLGTKQTAKEPILYHTACHIEWANTHKVKGQAVIANELGKATGFAVTLNKGCCGESGMGAVTSPAIYNLLRARKRASLAEEFAKGYDGPVLVGCPSCKIGIGRSLLAMHDKRPVLHITEWLASLIDGEDRRQSFKKKVNETKGDIRVIALPENRKKS
ncbi:MAG: (Fe-S)-binding protein, partial [Desulfovibrio sp.]|nr:(Fe-S)-binding protein [Desulfovibrio sp.]